MINLHHLYQFKTVADFENYTRAAEFLYISQPRLSKVIKLIEKEYGIVLFSKKSNRIRLTAEGKIFYEFASKTLELHDRLLFDLKKRKDPEIVRIATDIPPIMNFLAQHLIGQEAGFLTSFFQTTREQSLSLLEEDKADLVFTARGLRSTKTDIEHFILLEDELGMFIPEYSECGKKGFVTCDDLEDREFVRFMESDENVPDYTVNLLDQLLQKKGVRLQYVFTSNSNEVLTSYLRTHDAWLVGSQISSSVLSVPGRVFVPLREENTRFPIYVNYSAEHSFAAEKILQRLSGSLYTR